MRFWNTHDARPGNLRHTPQGILDGADEAARAAFQARRTPAVGPASASALTLIGR
jgi:hypothetical protein